MRSLEPHVLEAFRAETRRVIVRRGPFGIGFFLGLVGAAGLMELAYYPQRARPLAWSLALDVALCVTGLAARRIPRLERYIVGIVTCMTIGIAFSISGYMVIVGGSGDALAFALIVYLTGVPLLYPWGARGQVPLAFCVFGGYLVTLALGVRGELPAPYGIASVAGAAGSSILGAVFLDRHRRAIFHQRLLLARTRDEQMAVLYDVTRTVAATLELQQVLWLVCERVLDALALDRLWLLWREAPDRDLRGLEAVRLGERIEVSDFAGEASRWEALFHNAANATPGVLDATAEHKAALGRGDAHGSVLRIPLTVQSELVGMILAAGDVQRFASEASLLDLAATLGNSAAMAIANARLHAIVLAHRAELQRLSNKRIDVVEEGMRRISRELHDGVCQALMAIKLDLALLHRNMPDELRDTVHDIRAQVIDVVQSVRHMSHLLHPPALDDFGVVAAIESVAEKYRAASELEIRLTAPDPTIRCAAPVELMLFRVFQEALINVVKHSGARRMVVRLALDEDALVLEISDDGKGFESHAYFRSPPASAGLGLIGMRERVAHFGGVFRVTSRVGAGTRLYVSVPAEPVVVESVAAAL
ncbi:MAG: sensor histidine kinase [Deltaproteobacteria bacterium]|nr:MAG: sensor histidine kinase [Deltaproteobacteria bacterium]